MPSLSDIQYEELPGTPDDSLRDKQMRYLGGTGSYANQYLAAYGPPVRDLLPLDGPGPVDPDGFGEGGFNEGNFGN